MEEIGIDGGGGGRKTHGVMEAETNPLLPHLRAAWGMLDAVVKFITSPASLDFCAEQQGNSLGGTFVELRAAAMKAMKEEGERRA